MNKEDTKLNEILPIYRDIHNACTIMVDGIIRLSELNIVDEDIDRINQLDIDEQVDELMLLADDINHFKENSKILLDGII